MKTKVHFSTKMYQDTFHLKRYLESCYTETQLENTCNLCDDVINRWEFDFNKLSRSEQKKISPQIQCNINSLREVYSSKKQYFNEMNNKRIVVYGFC